jgi:hypothetical protein
VTRLRVPFSSHSASVRTVLLLAAATAALAGVYGRFKGLGTWPLGVDEFYISRSVDHILRTGLPGFPCGGYYTRGLLFQYLVAGLRLAGQSPEFSGRFLAALSSLAVIPAGYLLGKRVQGSLGGWLTAIILLVSIWEIEMGRFGRMYAPFQAVFAWYLVFYLRYTVDRHATALRWMIGLSIIGVLVWEGGALLGVANLFAVMQLHENGRLKRAELLRLTGLLLLLMLLYLATRDLRGSAAPGLADTAQQAVSSQPQFASTWVAGLGRHPLWCVAFLLPLGLVASSLRWIWQLRQRWLLACGLLAVLIAATLHAFAAAAGILALLPLAGLADWDELTSRQARGLWLALAALTLFWLSYEYLYGGKLIDALCGFPDVYHHIGRPWARAMPIMTIGLLVAGAYWFRRSVTLAARAPGPIACLLGLLLVMALAVSAIPTDRIETRYTFFLYPIALVLAVCAILDFAQRRFPGRTPQWLIMLLPLLCFAVTEDLQIRQLVHIDSAAANFRLGMRAARADHYYPLNDVRSVGTWLISHVHPGDMVVNGIPNLDEYYAGVDYFFLDQEDNRIDAYVCGDGRTERWTNHRLIYSVDGLGSVLNRGQRVYATVYEDVEERLRRASQSQEWTITRVYTAMDGKTGVLSIAKKSTASGAP